MDNKLTRAFESREGRKLTDLELRFLHAAGHGADARGRGATSDVGRMRALLKQQPSLLDTVGPVALSQAVGCSSYDAVRLLLDRGVRELYDGQTGRPREEQHEPITHAFYVGMGENAELDAEQVTRAGRFRILRTLFDAGIADASVISTSHVGWPGNTSLLFWAVYRRLEFSEFALEHGADPEAPISGNGERGTTVLQHAVAPPFDGASAPWDSLERWKRGLRFAEFLLSHGAFYDIFSACGRDDLDRVRALTAGDPGAVTRPGEAGMTPLHWAARAGAGKCARWLLARGADVNAETVARRTALHLAAEWGLTDVIWLLAGHGADLDPQDTKGRTPLHRAAYLGQVEAAEVLIVLGADTRLETRTGKTTLQSARLDCKFLKD